MSLAYSSAPVKQIREVQFGILSPEDIVRYSSFLDLSVSYNHSLTLPPVISYRAESLLGS
jgi:hypothetical protein